MPTYSASSVSDSVIAFRKPITLQQGRGLRDNPIAMAEGQTGAPRVQGRALGGVSMGNVTVSGTGGNGWIDCDLMGHVLMNFTIPGPGGTTLRVRFSSDNGATYGAWQNLLAIGGGGTLVASGQLRISLQTAVWRITGALIEAATATALTSGGTLTPLANTNAFQLSWTAAVTGNFDALCIGGIE